MVRLMLTFGRRGGTKPRRAFMTLRFFEAVRRTLVAMLAVIFLFSMTPQAARGQNYQDNYQDNYDDDVDQIVARVSFLQGPVSCARGAAPDAWDPAVPNVPSGLGDKLYSSADGRAELSLPRGSFVRIRRSCRRGA